MKRLGIIGCSRIFDKHFAGICESGVATAVAIADINDSRLNTRISETGLPGYVDYKEMIAKHRTRLDGVLIATPNKLHAEQAIYIASQGLGVLIEKPPTATYEEYLRLVEEAKKSNTAFKVVLQLRFDPVFSLVRDAIASGLLGELQFADLMVRFARGADYFASWHGDASEGGILADIGIHYIDYLLGVTGDTAHVLQTEESKLVNDRITDTYRSTIQLGRGGRGTIAISAAAPRRNEEPAIVIKGSGGRLHVGGMLLNEIKNVSFVHHKDAAKWDRLKKEASIPTMLDPIANFTRMYRSLAYGRGVDLKAADPVMKLISEMRSL